MRAGARAACNDDDNAPFSMQAELAGQMVIVFYIKVVFTNVLVHSCVIMRACSRHTMVHKAWGIIVGQLTLLEEPKIAAPWFTKRGV